jgi:glycosyltransferase involved in cell wall biosynthesis
MPINASRGNTRSAGKPDGAIRIAFVLTELVVGGAEMMLWKVISRIDRQHFTPLVVALSPRVDVMLDRFRACDVECHILGISSVREAPGAVLRLASALREFRPDVVQGWLYHGNIAATLATFLVNRRTPVMWSIRGAPDWSPRDLPQKRLTRWVGKNLSGTPARIVHNSIAGAVAHEHLGYSADRRVVLPNGFDTVAFQRSPEARRTIYRELQINDEGILVGHIARYDPLKDHRNFIEAIASVKRDYPCLNVLLAGEGLDDSNTELAQLIRQFDLGACVHLLGMRNDMNVVTAALDISVLSSTSEGFPNVVGEAMSCEVPCVVTDVGDCAWIVGNTGKIVPPHDSQRLSGAIKELLDIGASGRAALGRRARERIVQEFSLESVVRRYEDLFQAVCLESRTAENRTKRRVHARVTSK